MCVLCFLGPRFLFDQDFFSCALLNGFTTARDFNWSVKICMENVFKNIFSKGYFEKTKIFKIDGF